MYVRSFSLLLCRQAIRLYTQVLKMLQVIDKEGKGSSSSHHSPRLVVAAYSNRSVAYCDIGNFAAAVDDAETIIDRHPDNVKGYKRLAEAHKAIAGRESARLAEYRARGSGAGDAAGQQIESASASPYQLKTKKNKKKQEDEVRHITTGAMFVCVDVAAALTLSFV